MLFVNGKMKHFSQITQNFHYNKHKIVFSVQHDFIQVDLLQISFLFVIFWKTI